MDAMNNFVDGHVIVKYKASQIANADQQFHLAAAPTTLYGVDIKAARILNPPPSAQFASASLANSGDQGNLMLVELSEPGVESIEQAIRRFEDSPDVEYAEKNYKIALAGETACGCRPYGLRKISAPEAWEITKGDKSVVVGIIDTGIDFSHAALCDNIWVNPYPGASGYENDKYGYDFINRRGIDDSYLFNDDVGHGTHIAGTIGATNASTCAISGVALRVQMAALKVFDNFCGGTDATVIEAINYANNMGMPITNNSYYSLSNSRALREAVAASGLYVTCAGNIHMDLDENPTYPASYDLDNIIAVAATDQHDELTFFSSYGAKSVHIAAPGLEICSVRAKKRIDDIDGFITMSGTSMAAPHVVGVAALVLPLLECDGPLDRRWIKQLRDRILDNADSLPGLDGKVCNGRRLNALTAVKPKQ